MSKTKKQKPWWVGLLLMGLGAGVGYLGAALFFNNGSIEKAMNVGPEIFVVILMVLVSFFLVILIHEIGHVLGGLLMGNEFSMMVVGPFKLQKDDGKYSLTFNKSVAMAGGLALTLPTQVEGFKKRRAVTIGGGPFASLVLAIVAYIIHVQTAGMFTGLWKGFFLVLGLLSALIFVTTIIPMKAGGFMSDGMQLLMTFRNDEKAEKYANFMHLFALNNKGTQPKDLPLALFESQKDRPIEDIYDYAFQQYLYYKAIDENQLGIAAEKIQLLEKHLAIYPPNFQSEVVAEWVTFYGLIQPNLSERDRFLKDLDGQKPTMSKVALNTFEAALALSNGDISTAKNFAQKVMDTKKLEGTTKMYQAIVKHRILDI